ncbi:E3 ubiquitin-protein ligase Topors-like isoform X1 [Varroa destructor]|uniref:RING-type E3 ubiquitin transferase n=2 Tax=Varroa TaxID=62624 RepID=A0A7M7JPS8_VARDE|nr:E3 ubiquitin-protein ligase Topors-like isoform X1 [Varroa destructor]XP_022655060.1 E3 ubiquitin-protein ligase Topors-like isoform X1 [Varroa destructor]XP_022655070.1 E3 ubiquitin-protein ligase Topors-like isoform X1 [Varroa destructor]
MGYYARPNGYSRYREVSAEFYDNNPAQTHRLIPWLNRELVALLPPPHGVSLVLEVILTMICRVDIRSMEMRHMLDHYLGPYTSHFQHEFYCFASSTHDMVMYDRNVEYEYRPPLSYQEAVERLRRAFERDTRERIERGVGQGAVPRLGAEPGAVGQSAFRPWSPQPGPSRLPPPTTGSPQPSTSGTQLNSASTSGGQRGALVIVSSSDETSDDDDDCQIVKVIKPYRERTPVLIDLCNSTDSDSSEADTIPAEGPNEPTTLADPAELTSADESTSTEDDDNSDPVTRGRRKSIIGAYYPAGTLKERLTSSDDSDDSRKTVKTSADTKRQKNVRGKELVARRQSSRNHSDESSNKTKRHKEEEGTAEDGQR